MDLRSLRHVAALARLLSYTKAADALGLSQSALSRSIQAIEQRAGVRLFDRDRGGVHLTAVGRVFAERATGLLREADDLDRLLSRAASGSEGEVVFGMAPLPAAALLPAVLSESLAARPKVRCQVAVRSADALLALLLAEKIEFFVSAEGQIPDDARVKSAALGWFPTSLIVRAGHPLLSSAPGAEADGFPLIVAAPIEHRPTARAARAAGPPQVVLEDYGALVRLTEASDAIWLSSNFAVANEICAGRLAELPAPSGNLDARFRMMIYSLDRRSLSPAALRLKDQFRAQIRSLSGLLPAAGQPEPSMRG
jgi:DNA-binding transcriptional LysR family regulator